MIETRSSVVWNERDTLECRGVLVPTVPIETQLATMVARQQNARLDVVLSAIDSNQLSQPAAAAPRVRGQADRVTRHGGARTTSTPARARIRHGPLGQQGVRV
jgi:hypothetical protein